MHSDPRIEAYVRTILEGSCLAAEHRAEITEELLGHLELLADAKRSGGLDDEAAIQAALDDFGPPEVIRRQLRRQHRTRDNLQALAGLRRSLPALAAISALPAACIALASSGVLISWRITAATICFISMLVATWSVGYPLCLVRVCADRHLPQADRRAVTGALYWLGLSFISLAVSQIVLLMGAVLVCVSLQNGMPLRAVQISWGRLLRDSGGALAWEAWPILVFVSFVYALFMAGYRRRLSTHRTPGLAA